MTSYNIWLSVDFFCPPKDHRQPPGNLDFFFRQGFCKTKLHEATTVNTKNGIRVFQKLIIFIKFFWTVCYKSLGFNPSYPSYNNNKDTQLQLCIAEQAINYWCPDWVHHSYLYQSGKIHNVQYYTKYEQGSCKAIAGYTWR